MKGNLSVKKTLHMELLLSPDYTESSADGEERGSNRGSSPFEKVLQTSSSSSSFQLFLTTNSPSYQGNTDDDGGKEIGELEIKLESWLTGGLNCTRHARERNNIGDFNNNLLQMGVHNQITNKAMHPYFQIPNAPADMEKEKN